MGLLDSVIGQVVGQVVGQVLGGGRGGGQGGSSGGSHGGGQAAGGGVGGGVGDLLSSPIAKAILMLLLSKAASGGLGEIFGGGGRAPHREPQPDPGPSPYGRGGPQPDDGDLGGFGGPEGSYGGPSYGGSPRGGRGEGDFSNLSGMLDGPGDRAGQSPGQGPYAQLDREPGGGALGGGLDGLVQSFERSGLGDVIGSWIGHGGNRPVAPNRLADALGDDTLDSLSRQTGLDRDDLLQQLAQALPEVVNQLTPHGRAPSTDERRGWL